MKINNFDDYRAFLKSYITKLPKRGHGEVSKMAKALNVSPTMVSQVLTNEKQFSIEQGFELCRYLGFDEHETDYFICLLEKDRAGNIALKEYWAKKLIRLKSDSLDANKQIKKDRTLSESEKTIYYTHYLFTAIRLFCSIHPKKIHEIEERFYLTRVKALEYLNLLIDLALIAKSGDVYESTEYVIFLDKTSPQIYRHHMNWRIQAMKQIERPKEDDLSFSYPMTISKNDFMRLRKKWVAEILDIQKTLDHTDPEMIAFLNIDFFELT